MIMISARTLLIVFLAAFVVGLVALAPMRLLLHHLNPLLELPVQPQQVSGNLWSGEAVLPLAEKPYQLQWDWSTAALGSGYVGYDIALRSAQLDLSGTAGLRPGSRMVSGITGYADAQLFNDFLQPWNVTLDGQLWLSDTRLQQGGHGTVPAAEAQWQWRDGRAEFNWLDGSRRSVDLPILSLSVRTADEDGMVTAIIEDHDAGEPLLLAELSQDADLMYRLYTRLRDVLNVELPGGGEVIMESQLNVREYLL